MTNDEGKTNITILIVEDNNINRQLLYDLLTIYNFNVIQASNGREALEKIEAHKDIINLMLIDIRMPEINGFKLIEIIKENPEIKDIPIFVVSAHVMDSEKEQAAKLGCDVYINKPIDIEDLIGKINKLFKS